MDRLSHRFELARDGLTLSRQGLILPSTRPARELLPRLGPLYFRRLERLSLGLIRVRESEREIRFELWRTGLPLLLFAPPRIGAEAALYPITGGLLSAALDGVMELGARNEKADLHLWMEIRDYRSRLPRWLYRLTQAPLHHAIARDYLRTVVRALDERPAD